MKTLRRGISYNYACSILEANNYGITKTKAINDKIILYRGERPVARYTEATGRLEVVS